MARDTDTDWQHLADTDPYFAVLTIDRFHSDRIDAAGLDEFFASGVADIDVAVKLIDQRDRGFRSLKALDFGCGVGRLSRAMARHSADVTGLDVADGMVDTARLGAREAGVQNVRFVTGLEPQDRFDWINSFIVLQHIPTARGMMIIDDLLDRIVVGGFCSLHVTLFRAGTLAAAEANAPGEWFYDGDVMRPLVQTDQNAVGTIRMYDYDLNRILAMMVSRAIEPYALHMTSHGGNHGAWIFGFRNPSRFAVDPGRRYSAEEPEQVRRLLGKGWSTVEDRGVWTVGPEAIIELRIPDAAEATVTLAGVGLVDTAAYATLDIAVEANGLEVAQVRICEPDTRVAIEVSSRFADSRGNLRLRLSIDAPRSPKAMGISDDARSLGFYMESLTVS